MQRPFDFIPVGSQYYRFPTPTREKWAGDMRLMAECGFNTVKLLVQWRANNPREGVYDFSDIEELMDLARANNLRVILNTVFEPPAWFDRKYPDNRMIACDGRVLYPRVIGCRQTGGVPGPCYHHREGQAERQKFLTALAARLGGRPELLLWDLWNEPELTVGLLREAKIEDMVCYCEHSRQALIEWLRQKYGSVGALNDAWHGVYGDFEEVEMPRGTQVFKPMVDFREFFVDTMTQELRARAEAVRAADRLHPVMAHTVPLPYFNVMTSGSNDYGLASQCDLFGNSLGTDPFATACVSTAARGKTVINAEIHAVGGSTYGRPDVLSLNPQAFRRHLLAPFSRGVKGFQFWQFRPETLGFEAPAWGLLKLDGSQPPYLSYVRDICRAINRHAERLLNCAPRASRIAVLASDQNQIFLWCISDSCAPYYRSLRGTFDALYHAGYDVDIILEEQARAETLSRYAVVFAPFPYYMNAALCDTLRDFVSGGGTLIAEALFGGMRDEDGYHSEILPGYGFDRVFGCREDIVVDAASFNDAYNKHWSSGDERKMRVRLSPEREIAGCRSAATGYKFAQSFTLCGGRALMRFEDGRIAAVENEYGKGRAIQIGSLLGFDESNAELLTALARESGAPDPVKAPQGVRVDLLYDKSALSVIVAQNHTQREVSAPIAVPSSGKGTLRNLLDDTLIPYDGGFTLRLGAGDTAVWLFESV